MILRSYTTNGQFKFSAWELLMIGDWAVAVLNCHRLETAPAGVAGAESVRCCSLALLYT